VLLQKLGERKDLQAEEIDEPGTVDSNQEVRENRERESISFEQNQVLTEVTNALEGLEVDDKVSTEKWLEDTDASSFASCTKLQQEEDVSFSEIEDDESYSSDKLSSYRETQDMRGSSPEGATSTSDWVQLHESSLRDAKKKAIRLKGKDSEDESNDWLTVDDFN